MMQKLQRFGAAMFVPVLLFSFSGIVVALTSLLNNPAIFGQGRANHVGSTVAEKDDPDYRQADAQALVQVDRSQRPNKAGPDPSGQFSQQQPRQADFFAALFTMLQSHFFSSSPFLRIAKTDKFSSLVYQLKKRLAKTSYFTLTAVEDF